MKVTIDLNLPYIEFTSADMKSIGNDAIALIKERTQEGLDVNDKPFDAYSTKPIYVSKTSKTGKKLSPKGGRKTESGKSVFYQGGYSQYKKASSGSDKVDLTLSGNMMQSLVVKDATNTSFTIGIKGPAEKYAYEVNDEREFIGLSKEDSAIVTEIVQQMIMDKTK